MMKELTMIINNASNLIIVPLSAWLMFVALCKAMYSEIKKCLSVRLKIRLKKETRYCSGFQRT